MDATDMHSQLVEAGWRVGPTDAGRRKWLAL
jgi:hypothetical protein